MCVNNPTTRVTVGYVVCFIYKWVFRSAAESWSAHRYHSGQRRRVLVPTTHKSVCVCVPEKGWWGLPVIKSSVHADQDPVNQAARE